MTVFTYQESVVDLVTSVKKSLKTFFLNPFISDSTIFFEFVWDISLENSFVKI